MRGVGGSCPSMAVDGRCTALRRPLAFALPPLAVRPPLSSLRVALEGQHAVSARIPVRVGALSSGSVRARRRVRDPHGVDTAPGRVGRGLFPRSGSFMRRTGSEALRRGVSKASVARVGASRVLEDPRDTGTQAFSARVGGGIGEDLDGVRPHSRVRSSRRRWSAKSRAPHVEQTSRRRSSSSATCSPRRCTIGPRSSARRASRPGRGRRGWDRVATHRAPTTRRGERSRLSNSTCNTCTGFAARRWRSAPRCRTGFEDSCSSTGW